MATPITNLPLAGDLCDLANSAQCQLLLGGFQVDITTSSKWNMLRLDVGYDGTKLTFTEVATPTISYPTYPNETEVELQMDLSGAAAGLTTYFKGKVKERQHVGQGKQEAIVYTAWGLQDLSNEVTCLAWNNIPWYQRFAGTIIQTVSDSLKVYGTEIPTAITDIFTFNAADLAAVGVSSAIGTPGMDTWPAVKFNRELTIQNTQFLDALKQICSYYPQKKPYYDHTQDKWTFPDLLEAPEVIIDVGTMNVMEHVYTMSTANRYTAVHLYSHFDGRVVAASKGTGLCTKGWDPTLEADWSILKVAEEDPADLPESGGYTFVYRRWMIPIDTAEVNPNAPYRAYITVDYDGQEVYQCLDAYIDLNNGIIVTQNPVVVKGNAWDKDEAGAIGPTNVYFTWYKLDTGPGVGLMDHREPAAGFEGTAYSLFGLERVKTVLVDQTECGTVNARARLNMLKDVIVTASVPIDGDPIPELINLNKRIYFRSTVHTTAIASIPTILLGYTYEFGRRGKSTIKVSSDLSGLLKIN